MTVKVIGKPAANVPDSQPIDMYKRVGSELYKYDESKSCYVWVYSGPSKNMIVLKALYEQAAGL